MLGCCKNCAGIAPQLVRRMQCPRGNTHNLPRLPTMTPYWIRHSLFFAPIYIYVNIPQRVIFSAASPPPYSDLCQSSISLARLALHGNIALLSLSLGCRAMLAGFSTFLSPVLSLALCVRCSSCWPYGGDVGCVLEKAGSGQGRIGVPAPDKALHQFLQACGLGERRVGMLKEGQAGVFS